MRALARRIFCGVFSAVAAASIPAQLHNAEADELQVAAAAGTSIPVPVPAKRVMGTRFIIGLDRKVEFQVFSLSNPNRVVVELPEVNVRLPTLGDAPAGLVKTFRAGLAAAGKTRIVIDVTQPVIVESSKVVEDGEGDYRLALAILPAIAGPNGQPKSLAARTGLGPTALQPPLPRRAENPKERAARMFRPVIVLDPGHGGYDSGAEKFGTVEKDVVLRFGLVLRDLLEKTGRYKVMMTRSDDTFIPLDERTRYAERNKANLFIAIHADYSDEGGRARGATIYSLRDGVAKSLERSAKGSISRDILSPDEINTVKSVNGDVNTVKDILADLADRDVELTHERTGMFAKSVIENMGESTPLRNEPEQQAAFRVLKTAQFPSVLIELAYVTNKSDAQNLKSDEWREKVANSILAAIDNYFSRDIARLPM
ncbi:N-acetylmuramoyl-L-alanine amidase [Hyphomicrobium sp.]|uniref:N-acetylmuramoyl-L-alanine amidase n=1 Tax=Hyphomicrobium sp. TaxID=82 RepID=UPI000FC1049D|nr:N-acetylmuramoyl-L-alanine amidase [Hyphomicrobium sp.]RUO97691.1 MAG: N-acetylmuramoyl-L-alanine amidase [Hyphomicrobium sp.]